GHLVIHEDQVVWPPRVGRAVEFHESLLAGSRDTDLEGHRLERLREDVARGFTVVHDEDAQAAKVADQAGEPGPRLPRQTERHREQEGAAFARLAFDPNPAAHHLDEALADRQPQPGAAELARGRAVRLRERLEELRDLLGGHPDAAI